MELRKIESLNPVSVEQVAIEYRDLFNTLILVRPAQGEGGTASIYFTPYNAEEKKLLNDPTIRIEVSNFWKFVVARPTLAQVVSALTIELGKLAREAELEKLLADGEGKETPNGDLIAAWQAQLVKVRQEMGAQ